MQRYITRSLMRPMQRAVQLQVERFAYKCALMDYIVTESSFSITSIRMMPRRPLNLSRPELGHYRQQHQDDREVHFRWSLRGFHVDSDEQQPDGFGVPPTYELDHGNAFITYSPGEWVDCDLDLTPFLHIDDNGVHSYRVHYPSIRVPTLMLHRVPREQWGTEWPVRPCQRGRL